MFIVRATGKSKRRLERLEILELLPPYHLLIDRKEALKQALVLVKGFEVEANGALSNQYQSQVNNTPTKGRGADASGTVL